MVVGGYTNWVNGWGFVAHHCLKHHLLILGNGPHRSGAIDLFSWSHADQADQNQPLRVTQNRSLQCWGKQDGEVRP